MAKIQPQQYIPYSPNVPSGNIHTEVGANFINYYLLESLTGNFNFVGSLRVNGVNPIIADPSNNFGGTRVGVFGGENNFATGQEVSIVNASNSNASGVDNLILNGDSNQIIDANSATILAGYNSNIGSGHNGAVILGDSDSSRYKETISSDSLMVDFKSGSFFKGDLRVNGDFYIGPNNSGLSSGEFNFLTDVYQSGSPLVNFANFSLDSGRIRNDYLAASGSLEQDFIDVSGFVTGEYVSLDGNQTINGLKTFANDVFITTGSKIGGQETIDSYIKPSYYSTGSSLTGLNILASSPNGIMLVVDSDSDGNYHDKTQEYTKNGFSVKRGLGNHNQASLLFGLSPSGLGYFRQGLVIGQPYVPTFYNSSGHSGQCAWGGEYFYLATGENAWGRVQVAPW